MNDEVLQGMAKKLADTDDNWEALGAYLTVDKNIMDKSKEKLSKTMPKYFVVLKKWKRKTQGASRSQLEALINKFKASQHDVVVASRSSLCSSASSLSE